MPTFTHNDWWIGGHMQTDLDVGELCEEAEGVFCNGQCHSLAIALAELLGTEVVALIFRDEENWHMAAVLPDGTGWVDYQGVSDWDHPKLAEAGRCEPTAVAAEALLASLDVADMGWHEFQVEDARSFAQPLLDLHREILGQLSAVR